MAQNGGGKGWITDPESGIAKMPRHWELLLEWRLLGPERQPKFQQDFAAEHDMHADSLRRIKRDPRFIKEWDRRASELNINPERVQSVIDALWAAAAGGDVKAASLYLQYIDKFTPRRKMILDDERDVAGYSNEELAEALEAEVIGLRMVESA
jgi:hypothetical protein